MYDALVTAFAVFAGVAGHELFGMSMMSRPIVVAPLVGALMGDIQIGLAVGASLEAIFMGVVNIGVSGNAEPALAAGLAAAFTIKTGGGVDAIIPIVFPLAILGLQINNMILSVICGPMATKFFEFAKKNEQRKMINWHYLIWVVHFGLYTLLPFFAVLFGANVVTAVLNGIPDVIMNGLTVAGNILPAVGMAMLLGMLWRNDIAIWFFLGAILLSYFDIPLIAIAFIGAVVAIVVAQRDLQLKKMKSNTVTTSNIDTSENFDQEEEDFFK